MSSFLACCTALLTSARSILETMSKVFSGMAFFHSVYVAGISRRGIEPAFLRFSADGSARRRIGRDDGLEWLGRPLEESPDVGGEQHALRLLRLIAHDLAPEPARQPVQPHRCDRTHLRVRRTGGEPGQPI